MADRNIWQGFNFDGSGSKSVYEYLQPQANYLSGQTESLLTMEIERYDAYLENTDPPVLVGINTLLVKAPNLGGFRKKILVVVEGGYEGVRYPVDIHCVIDNTRLTRVPEDQLLERVSEILEKRPVQDAIKTLFAQSREYRDLQRKSDQGYS